MAEPMYHTRMAGYLEGLVRRAIPVMQEDGGYARETAPDIGAAAATPLSGCPPERARQIFELGSGYGYSRLVCRAVRENGEEWSPCRLA